MHADNIEEHQDGAGPARKLCQGRSQGQSIKL